MLHNDIIEIWEINFNNKNFYSAQNKLNYLSREEKKKLSHFKFIKNYKAYLISHTALRELMSRYTDIAPNNIKYEYTKKGKPKITQEIFFNLSHTNKKSLIAFYKRDIGVDIEYKKDREDYNSMGKLVFTKNELQYMNCNSLNTKYKFYELWTKKEALLKALGIGLNEKIKNLSTITRKNFYCGKYLWQIKKIEINKLFISHIVYKSNFPIKKIRLNNFKFSE